MALLLTDKELKAIIPDRPACAQTAFSCDECSGQCQEIAKAQLEKVYQHAQRNNWCRYETSGMPHEGVSYPLTKKDFELGKE